MSFLRPSPFAQSVPEALHDLQPVAVMDGDCTLCSVAARTIDRLDRSGSIHILPIQTERGQAALRHYGIDDTDPSTWLFLADGCAWSGLEASVEVGRRSGGLGRIMTALMVLPRPLRAWLYARIARNRYALFGRTDICAIPSPSLKARLLT